MLICHGTEDDPHSPTEIVKMENSNVTGHENLKCPNCGIVLETGEFLAKRVTMNEQV